MPVIRGVFPSAPSVLPNLDFKKGLEREKGANPKKGKTYEPYFAELLSATTTILGGAASLPITVPPCPGGPPSASVASSKSCSQIKRTSWKLGLHRFENIRNEKEKKRKEK